MPLVWYFSGIVRECSGIMRRKNRPDVSSLCPGQREDQGLVGPETMGSAISRNLKTAAAQNRLTTAGYQPEGVALPDCWAWSTNTICAMPPNSAIKTAPIMPGSRHGQGCPGRDYKPYRNAGRDADRQSASPRRTRRHPRALAVADGCTGHRVTEIIDDGPILGRAAIPPQAGDTPRHCHAEVLRQEPVRAPLAV